MSEFEYEEIQEFDGKQVYHPEIEQEEVQLYEPLGEIPPYWKAFVHNTGLRVLQHAVTFGLVIPEFTMKDYVRFAIKVRGGGYETIDVWGVQGSKKSCRTLAISHWAYQDWDVVLEEMVLMPDAKDLPAYKKRGFLQKLQMIEKGEAVPLEAWDDITVGMPSASFKTDVHQYAAVDSAFAAIRTKMRVMVVNNPLIDRLTKNIKDNISIECFLGRNQVEEILRFIRLPGFKHLESNFFKIPVEPLHIFDWRYVPKDVFQQYFDLRLEIADYAVHKMGKAFGDEAAILEDMVGAKQMWAETPIALTTLNDMIRRNFIPSEKINGKVYVKKEDWDEFKQRVSIAPDRRRRNRK